MASAQVILGGLYWVPDDAISLPPEDDREGHPRRMVVVLSGPDTNSDAVWLTVLVAPLSSSTKRKTRFCVKLAAGEANVTKKVWVRVPAVQPLAKKDLQDRVGLLASDRLAEVQARLFEYMGLASEDDEAEG